MDRDRLRAVERKEETDRGSSLVILMRRNVRVIDDCRVNGLVATPGESAA